MCVCISPGGQHHGPAALLPGIGPGTYCTGGWTGAKNLVPTSIRTPDRPARSESLYRLSYPVPPLLKTHYIIISRKGFFNSSLMSER